MKVKLLKTVGVGSVLSPALFKMAAVMEVLDMESPEMENGGGLFGPSDDDEEMVHSLGKVRTAVQ